MDTAEYAKTMPAPPSNPDLQRLINEVARQVSPLAAAEEEAYRQQHMSDLNYAFLFGGEGSGPLDTATLYGDY